MREIRKSGSEGGAGQNNVPFLPLSLFRAAARFLPRILLVGYYSCSFGKFVVLKCSTLGHPSRRGGSFVFVAGQDVCLLKSNHE